MSYARPYLLSFRARQRRLFDSTVTIKRHTGYQDAAAGRSVEAVTVPVYTGAAQVLAPEAVSRSETIGAEPVVISAWQVTLPHDTDPQVGDVVTVDSSFDPGLVGMTLRIVSVRRSEWLVNRTCRAEAV